MRAESTATGASTATRHIRSAQLGFLFASVPQSLGVNVILSLLTVSVLWDAMSHEALVLWLEALALVTVLRAGLWIAYRRSNSATCSNTAPWDRLFLAGVLAAGCVWGAAGPFVIHAGDLREQVFFSFVVAGLSAGAITSLGPDRRAALLFVIPAVLPLAVALLLQPGPGREMGTMVLLYCAFIAASADRTHQMIVANMRLGWEAEDGERDLARAEARKAAMISSALDCIITLDADGNVLEFNPAAERTFGFARAEALGRPLAELIVPPEQRDAHVGAIRRYRRNQPSNILGRRVEVMAQRRNGQRFPVELTVLEVGSDSDVVYTAYLRDISERKASEAAVKAREVAEAASRAKSAFLAAVSHEIRTPLNAILGQLELLSYSPLDGNQRDTVKLVHESSRALLSLIDDILDFSKIEAGKLEIRQEAVDLRALVDQVHGIFSATANAKGLVFDRAVMDELPRTVLSDGLRLRQILSNLLSNAIKFTERGSISLTVETAGKPGEPHWTRFQVRDGGIGMSQETLARLFTPFEQADLSTSRRFGGTGLGLAISQRLAGALRGSLQVSSTPGQGTVASLEVPLAPAPAAAVTDARQDDTYVRRMAMQKPAPSIEVAARSGRLILTVDDYPANRRLLVSQLNWLGFASEDAADGAEALEKYRARGLAGTPYCLVITDCQMPGIDGLELARRIRAEESGHRTPILAFTANTLGETAAECRAAGMDDVLHKPVSLAGLTAKLDRWLPREVSARQILGVAGAPSDRFGEPWTPEVFDEFRAAHDDDVEVLRNGLRTKNAAALARVAHGINGAARMLGAEELSQAAAALERAARAADWAAIEAAVPPVMSATQRLYERVRVERERRTA